MSAKSWAAELRPEIRAVLDAGRGLAAPSHEREAVWTALRTQLPVLTSATATGRGVSTLALLKPFAVGLLLGVLTATGSAIVQSIARRAPAPPTAATVAHAAPPATAPNPEREHATPPATEPRVADVTPSNRVSAPAPTPSAATEPSELVAPGPSVAAFPDETPAPAMPENAVLLESRRVARARSLLQEGDFDGVLAALDALDRAFPRGVLAQERDALRIEALLARGDRVQARDEARRFLERHPESPHAPAVERALY